MEAEGWLDSASLAVDRARRIEPDLAAVHLTQAWISEAPDSTAAQIAFRLTPPELLGRLATLLPPPRVHRHRYHGVLAPSAALRPLVTPTLPTARPSARSGPRGPVRWTPGLARIQDARPPVCPACGERTRLIARPASGGCPTDPFSIREVPPNRRPDPRGRTGDPA